MRRALSILLASCAGLGALPVKGDPAPANAPAPTMVSPAMEEAIGQVSAGNEETRDAGMRKLEGVMAAQMKALVGSDDPETQSRVMGLLQFNEGLTAWVLETLKLPEDRARDQISFCLRAEVLPKIGGLFVIDSEKRAQGVAALAKFEDAPAGMMLLQLMEDRDAGVRTAALASLKGRKATPEMVDALWKVSVEEEMSYNNSPLSTRPPEQGQRVRQMDEKFINQACDVLISLQAPEVNAKLKSVMERVESYYAHGEHGNGPPWVMDDRYPPLRSAARLLKAYKPREAYPVLYRIVAGKAYQGASIAVNDKGQVIARTMGTAQRDKDPVAAAEEDLRIKLQTKATYYWSTRTMFIELFVEMTGQKPDDYLLRRAPVIGGLWSVATQEDENKSVEMVKTWWIAHGKDYGEPATQGAAK